MNKKITQLENKLEKIKKDKTKAQQQKEEAETLTLEEAVAQPRKIK